MREPGEVLLLSCYELGHQPIGLASPMGFLERAGYRPAGLDLSIEKLDEAAVRKAKLVGVSVPMHTALRIGMRAAERVRVINPEAHLCFYGLYAPLNRELLLGPGVDGARPRADSVVGGEYEEAVLALVQRVESEAASPSPSPAAPSSAADRKSEVVLSRLHFAEPSRAHLPSLSRYAKLLPHGVAQAQRDGRQEIAGYTEASRGCLHLCRHCPLPAVYDGRFFVIPVEVVLADVRAQVQAGATHVTLGDPDFLNGPNHAMSVARAIHREFPSLTFDITTKVEHILKRRDLFPELRALGCLFVVSAVESLSDRVLAILDKGHTRADVDVALAIVRGAGITLRPSFVPFTPWGSLDEYLELMDFLDDNDLVDAVDPIQLAIRLLLPPGSLLLEHPATRPFVDGIPLDPATLSYRWRHPDPRMDALQQKVAARAGADAGTGVDPTLTFAALRDLARTEAGLPSLPAREREPSEGAPKLSEAWFCCAEPTEDQMGSF